MAFPSSSLFLIIITRIWCSDGFDSEEWRLVRLLLLLLPGTGVMRMK